MELWHHRLGHAPLSKLKHIPQILPFLSQPAKVCVTCPLAKFQKLPFSLSNSRAKAPFDLVHIDIWGPYREYFISSSFANYCRQYSEFAGQYSSPVYRLRKPFIPPAYSDPLPAYHHHIIADIFIASALTLFPPEYVKEFQKCFDQAPTIPFEGINAILNQELKRPIDSLYEYIDPTPLASASIAQVDSIIPGSLPSSITGPVILVVRRADGDEEL
ncbi:hypothetical protein BVRB_006640 [Beta vulgaris subsp. vulgaris]|uniref:ABC1 atypical kinase-like domain-containing protein n=1 Tax=Beta vulgaris subsp. vulgaris TaxID=3555 RepID=A0A0J8B3Q7_BETVV|nr:hypothetical protein BVRB_006640 [Beta vulgaris subsp. vulgaris]